MNRDPRRRRDAAEILLHVALWLLPASRESWARAMRAELASLTKPGERLLFALGCIWAALKAPAENDSVVHRKESAGIDQLRRPLMLASVAIATLFTAPLLLQPLATGGAREFPLALLPFLWLLATWACANLSIVIGMVRGGEMPARPLTILLRAAATAVAAAFWLTIVQSQLAR